MAKEMGLDRAPIEFRKLVFLVPPNADWWWSSMMISILNTTKTQTYEKWAFTFQGSQIIYAWAMDAKSLELPEGVGLVGLAYATT